MIIYNNILLYYNYIMSDASTHIVIPKLEIESSSETETDNEVISDLKNINRLEKYGNDTSILIKNINDQYLDIIKDMRKKYIKVDDLNEYLSELKNYSIYHRQILNNNFKQTVENIKNNKRKITYDDDTLINKNKRIKHANSLLVEENKNLHLKHNKLIHDMKQLINN
jgi:hypothetical protein